MVKPATYALGLSDQPDVGIRKLLSTAEQVLRQKGKANWVVSLYGKDVSPPDGPGSVPYEPAAPRERKNQTKQEWTDTKEEYQRDRERYARELAMYRIHEKRFISESVAHVAEAYRCCCQL